MMGHSTQRAWSVGMPALLFILLGSCVDEEIVYRDGPTFVTPPDNAASFLGYSDESAKRTVCGSCHIGQQTRWEATAHADAWATLANSGNPRGSCERCHTVNNQGNVVTDTVAGWRSTKDDRYHDVQCESCHGPGLPHVTSPQRGQMLASIHADTGAAVTNGCSECHSGTHHGFVNEWRLSRHANAPTHQYDDDGRPEDGCKGCHIGQYVLEAWGVNTNFIEKEAGESVEGGEPITCAVCHDSHGSTNSAQLRFPVDVADTDLNLCAKCHNRRSEPQWSSSRGTSPHAPHGPLVFGTAGWWPPNLDFVESQSTHGSEANPRLCAGCHVQRYDVSDKETGEFVVSVVGHRFLAAPCVDANGMPTEVQKNEDGTPACSVTQRSFRGCASSSCHGNSETIARNAFITATNDVNGLVALLDGMIAQVPASEFAANKVNAGRGAQFNSNMAKMTGSQVHNPILMKALLRYSGVALNETYGIPLPPGLAPTALEEAAVRMKQPH